MKKIKAQDLKGQNVYGINKQGQKLLVNLGKNIQESEWYEIACSKCENTEMPIKGNLRECPCGNTEFIALKFDWKELKK